MEGERASSRVMRRMESEGGPCPGPRGTQGFYVRAQCCPPCSLSIRGSTEMYCEDDDDDGHGGAEPSGQGHCGVQGWIQ